MNINQNALFAKSMVYVLKGHIIILKRPLFGLLKPLKIDTLMAILDMRGVGKASKTSIREVINQVLKKGLQWGVWELTEVNTEAFDLDSSNFCTVLNQQRAMSKSQLTS